MKWPMLGDPVERKTMPGGSATLFNHSDVAFDLRDVFVGARKIENRTAWHGIHQRFEGCEFRVGMHSGDTKTAMEIVLEDLLERFENLWDNSVKQILRLSVRKKGILLTKNISAVKKTSLWRLSISIGTSTKSVATGMGLVRVVFPFSAAALSPPDLVCDIDICHCHWAILDLMATNDPCEILP
jgi:hypothetical protein